MAANAARSAVAGSRRPAAFAVLRRPANAATSVSQTARLASNPVDGADQPGGGIQPAAMLLEERQRVLVPVGRVPDHAAAQGAAADPEAQRFIANPTGVDGVGHREIVAARDTAGQPDSAAGCLHWTALTGPVADRRSGEVPAGAPIDRQPVRR
jgi:hypothetical protein